VDGVRGWRWTGERGSWLITLMVSAWGLRLSGYLAWRNLGQGRGLPLPGDAPYWGDRFPIVSLFTVFLLQGVLMFVVSLPVQMAQMSGGPDGLVWISFVGLGRLRRRPVRSRAVGDLQLARFKADPANEGKVMDRGLWRYTRHPNYFGDFVVWWGMFLVAMARPELAWTAIGPLVMSVLLMQGFGGYAAGAQPEAATARLRGVHQANKLFLPTATEARVAITNQFRRPGMSPPRWWGRGR
jgi:steroid 5-alpha reductase family enzyme